MPLLIFSILFTVGAWIPRTASKTTIEPCSTSNTCSALVGYTLYTDLKVSEVAALFSVDPIDVLLTNAMDISYPDVENHILPSQLFLKIPTTCSCVDGIRRSGSVSYMTRTSDTLANISSHVYGGLVSPSQINQSNPKAGISETSVIPSGIQLSILLPCTCFNNSDNNLPAIYMSYVVRQNETLDRIAAAYHTTVTDLKNVNSLGSSELDDGDIIAIPLPACASNFPSYADDHGLVVPEGSYAVTGRHCVQCTCGPQSQFILLPRFGGSSLLEHAMPK
ncbi:LysM domain-containing GPI-anchored protein 1 [Orobanche gracilis]